MARRVPACSIGSGGADVPELPEVDAITGVVAKYALRNDLQQVDVLRGEYMGAKVAARAPAKLAVWQGNMRFYRVYRLGKRVVMEGMAHWGPTAIVSHMMMTGYYDWEHEPWTFDYVEGRRDATESDVRVRFHFADGKVLRFHDTRLFGTIENLMDAPHQDVPELMITPHMMPNAAVIELKEFARLVLRDHRPIKDVVMDQTLLAGIGNIYANEGCHLAQVNPHTPGCDVRPEQVPILLASLRCVVAHSIPTVRYDWLKVYRRDRCGSCGSPVVRSKVAGRATFTCRKCQGDAT